MAINIKLLVHGVPNGQDKWNVSSEDMLYIQSFYSSKPTVTESLTVERRIDNGTSSFYYTFLVEQNVVDFEGRKGAYFALTLKLNVFYADVANIYNLLRMAFYKVIVGLCIKQENARFCFSVKQFHEVESQLKDLEKSLINYIGQFSIHEDIVQLPDKQSAGPAYPKPINLLECTKEMSIEIINEYSSFLTSVLFPSVQIITLKEQCDKEISECYNKTDNVLREQEEKHKTELDSCKSKYDAEIQELNKQISDKDAKFQKEMNERIGKMQNEYGQKIRKSESKCQELVSQLKEKDRLLKNRNRQQQDKEQRFKEKGDGHQPSSVKEDEDTSSMSNSEIPTDTNHVADDFWKFGSYSMSKEVGVRLLRFLLLILNTILLIVVLALSIRVLYRIPDKQNWDTVNEVSSEMPDRNSRIVNQPHNTINGRDTVSKIGD